MLVHLYQYKREELDYDDNRTAGESQTEEGVDPGPEEYFGEELDLETATWETVEYDGTPVQRRELAFEDVTAVSRPGDPSESELPGTTLQVRKAGDSEQLENVVVADAEDRDPG